MSDRKQPSVHPTDDGQEANMTPSDLTPERQVALRRGLDQSANGEVVDLGDFTQYADDASEPVRWRWVLWLVWWLPLTWAAFMLVAWAVH